MDWRLVKHLEKDWRKEKPMVNGLDWRLVKHLEKRMGKRWAMERLRVNEMVRLKAMRLGLLTD